LTTVHARHPKRSSFGGAAEPLRVTIVAHDVGGLGGMDRQLQAVIARLLDRGTRVVVVSRTLGVALHPSLTWHRVRGPARPFVLAYPWFALVASIIVARRRVGVLQTTGAIVLNRADLCTVHYLHGGPGGAVERASRQSLAYRLNARMARRMSRAAERVLYRRADKNRILVAVSERVAGELRSVFPGRASAIRVIRNGVDTQRFRPDAEIRRVVRRALGVAESDHLALFVGSDWPRKGVDIAVEALTGAPNWNLVVVGKGDARALETRAVELGVGARTKLVGEHASPERYATAADAFVLPSAYETFLLSAFEAAAAGLPVIATEVGSVSEIVDGGGGVLVERDAASIATELRRLESNPADAVTMSTKARETARGWGWDEVVDDYVSLYRELGS
jgi:glycosyltransferase involved in cell wall biosynthesis